MKRVFLFFSIVVFDVCLMFGQQPKLDSEDSVLLNYLIMRNDYLLSEVQDIRFIGKNSDGEQFEFPCSSYLPGNLQMCRSDYAKMQECSEITLCFGSDIDKYSKVSTISYYEVPLFAGIWKETFVLIRVFDKVREIPKCKDRYNKIRARRVNNGLDYTAIYYTKRDSVFTVGPQI